MNVLVLSNLFPNPVQTRKGVFVRERLRHVARAGDINFTVLAPVPWFPFKGKRFGAYGEFALVPKVSRSDFGDVYHPRYFLLPKIGAQFAPKTYAASVLRTIKRYGLGPFDLVDAHFMFPDAAAAVLVGEALGVPVVATARGSDLNVMPDDRFAGPWIDSTLRSADAIVGVSAALAERAVSLGAPENRTHVLRNGVDRARFAPGDTAKARDSVGFTHKTVLVVGNLVAVKGQALAIEALAHLPDWHLT